MPKKGCSNFVALVGFIVCIISTVIIFYNIDWKNGKNTNRKKNVLLFVYALVIIFFGSAWLGYWSCW